MQILLNAMFLTRITQPFETRFCHYEGRYFVQEFSMFEKQRRYDGVSNVHKMLSQLSRKGSTLFKKMTKEILNNSIL